MMSVVPVSFPGKLFFVGFVASTIIVKLDAGCVPALSLITFLITVRNALPDGGVDLSLVVTGQGRVSCEVAVPVQSEKLAS